MSRAKKPTKRDSALEAVLATLRAITEDPHSEHAQRVLRAALADERAAVVARAAQLIKESTLSGFSEEMLHALERFYALADLGCIAKTALLQALDFGEHPDAQPFMRAVTHVQMEAAWPEAVDGAGGLRARALLGLARIGHAELDLIAAERLHDTQSLVRQAALDALAQRELANTAGLVLFKLRMGDDDPLVTLAAMSALLVLAPRWALDTLAPMVMGREEDTRELAAVALGQSRRDDTLSLLHHALQNAVHNRERVPILRGIALHRSDRALALMLEVVASGASPDARAAVAALAARRFEPKVVARVKEAAARNVGVDLAAVLADAFD